MQLRLPAACCPLSEISGSQVWATDETHELDFYHSHFCLREQVQSNVRSIVPCFILPCACSRSCIVVHILWPLCFVCMCQFSRLGCLMRHANCMPERHECRRIACRLGCSVKHRPACPLTSISINSECVVTLTFLILCRAWDHPGRGARRPISRSASSNGATACIKSRACCYCRRPLQQLILPTT